MDLFWRFFIAIVGVVMYGAIFNMHLRRKDGIGRIFILIFSGTALFYFLVRLIALILYYVFDIISSRNIMDTLRWGLILWLVPSVFILMVEYFYKYKDKE